jgi:hypothetical protein
MYSMRSQVVILPTALLALCGGCEPTSNTKPNGLSKQALHQTSASELERGSKQGDLKLEEFGESEGFSGAGTAFQFESAPPNSTGCIFGYGSEDDPADIKINGKVYTLTCRGSKTISPGHGRSEIGKEEEWIWSNNVIAAIFRFKTVSTGKDEFAYRGTLTLSMGGKTSVFRIKGGTGD